MWEPCGFAGAGDAEMGLQLLGGISPSLHRRVVALGTAASNSTDQASEDTLLLSLGTQREKQQSQAGNMVQRPI